ncbi:hypothetical protein [Phenylobacterium sp.]|uniref:hypothetical protein n=1 Tax=Phenylobacterium sp. TaxID=1871053 RepID=UPI0025E489E8|nr:hypothetical protein [Phenylobacterium sp.]MBX3481999.1 hypothetical protein [Phenylobacterium sp.]MCW5761500.1 hypothetical protein [Phenylobacterium sp.]
MIEVTDTKLPFAGPAWIAAAGTILRDLAAAYGEPGQRFSLCERFTDAPPDVAASGLAAWWFRIDGTTAEAGPGEIGDADASVTADYAATLPVARLVYTPEIIAERRARRERGKLPSQQGDWSRAPRYLTELHNRLAVITA